MSLKAAIFLGFTFIMISGCSGTRGRGQAKVIDFTNICVINNPKVTVPRFEEDLVHQLEIRGLHVEVVKDKSECASPFTLNYTALRSIGAVTAINLSLYNEDDRVAYIDWNAGRSPMPPKISTEVTEKVEYWQTAEALAGLFGEIKIK